MRVMLADWYTGLLDETLDGHRQVRIRVTDWMTLAPVTGQYFEYGRSLALLWNYVRDAGLSAVVRKVLSRHRERHRNQRFVACGLGEVLAGPNDLFRRRVVFLAPNAPRCAERVVLDRELVRLADGVCPPAGAPIRYIEPTREAVLAVESLASLAGWSPFSGTALEWNSLTPLLDRIGTYLQNVPVPAPVRLLRVDPVDRVQERREAPSRLARGPTAALFGFGNYSKVVVLPIVSRYLHVAAIHEIDPLQLGSPALFPTCTVDTAARLRSDESYDAVFVAGYHHTHADIAVDALDRGAWAVVEKPIATTLAQLDRIAGAVDRHGERLFACLQRRYTPANRWIKVDLAVQPGDPLDYHCIVFEVPLPPLHWYNWPNSRSRLVSNGCHWVDHFMWLNDFSEVTHSRVWRARNGDLGVGIELANTAVFAMTLSQRGSARLGVRDLVEVRSRGASARLLDGTAYTAENSRRLLRRRLIGRMTPYQAMYASICRRIIAGQPGDSRESLRSAYAVLTLERLLGLDDAREGSPDVG